MIPESIDKVENEVKEKNEHKSDFFLQQSEFCTYFAFGYMPIHISPSPRKHTLQSVPKHEP